jgi:hypothetical protein
MQQVQNSQVATSGSPQTSHMAGLQNIGFPTGMMQPPGNNQVRRVTPLNSSGGSMGGMHPGQQGIGGVTMGMNPQTSMPAQLRQAAAQQHQLSNLRLQQQHQMIPGQQMSSEMIVQRNAGNGVRTNSAQAQLMNSLPQSQQPLPGGIQQSHSQNNFQNAIPHQHPQQHISPPPRPPSHPQTQPSASVAMNMAGPSQSPGSRGQLPQDPAMFMNFQNEPKVQHGGNRIPPNGAQFSFVPSSTPPIQHSGAEMSRPMTSGASTASRGPFHMTPAQQYEQMQHGNEFSTHLSMPPPQHRPPRPPSHDNNHPHQQLQHSPPNSDSSAPPPRPQSQPQSQTGRPPSQSGSLHTTRNSQVQLTPNHGGVLQQRTGPPQLPDTQPSHPPRPLAIGPSATGPIVGPTNEPGAPQTTTGVQRPSIGLGQGLLRLLQFSGILAGDVKHVRLFAFSIYR